jgi:hypothetical protein
VCNIWSQDPFTLLKCDEDSKAWIVSMECIIGIYRIRNRTRRLKTLTYEFTSK